MSYFENAIELFGNDRYVDLLDLIYEKKIISDFNDIDLTKKIKDFQKIIKDKSSNIYLIENVILYHGTSENIDIENEGIKRTTNKTKKSLQSATGYVYLSLYPDMAFRFGELAYPYDDVKVYAVKVPLFDLVADKDQLNNKREFFPDLGNSLAESLVFGSGARLKRDVKNYEVRDFTDFLKAKNKLSMKKR